MSEFRGSLHFASFFIFSEKNEPFLRNKKCGENDLNIRLHFACKLVVEQSIIIKYENLGGSNGQR